MCSWIIQKIHRKALMLELLFKNTLFYRTSPVAVPENFSFPACNFIIKETTTKMFFCEFCKIFKDIFSFDRTPQDDCFLCLYVNFEFFRTLLLEHLRKTAISCTSWRISTTRYSKKLFHRSFQAFYTRTRSSHSKVYLLKISKNCLWRS